MTAPVGFTFRETMAGPFALGESDPTAGYEKGKAQGSKLKMHATVTINDVQTFVDDPAHTGRLTGCVDFSEIAKDMEAPSGLLQLFSPTDDPQHKVMVYELGFQHADQPYYLAGRKEVRDDPGIDVWKDTTTLFTRLYGGTDKSGPVIGAGILTLGPGELLRMVSTMRVVGGKPLGDQFQTFVRFGRFFFGELWDGYVATKLCK